MRRDTVAHLLRAAVENNRQWCATVVPGRTVDDAVWLADAASVAFFPDAVTLVAGVAAADVARALADRRSCSVKDSFADLDLGPHGFEVLFAARWIGRQPDRRREDPDGWSVVTSTEGIDQWCAAAEMPALAGVGLLDDDRTRVLVRRDGSGVTAGAVATIGVDVVGLSNVFSRHPAPDPWPSLVAAAAVLGGPGPLVGYERGADLDAARAAGFTDLGPLRVWARDQPVAGA